MKKVSSVLILAGMGILSTASAGEWSGSAEAGFLASDGNSKTRSLNAAFAAAYATQDWTHSLKASASSSSNATEVTGERYTLGGKSALSISEFDYLFGSVDAEKDRFGGFDQRISEALGYGRRILKDEQQNLTAEIGVGARQSELTDGTSQNEGIVRGNIAYSYAFAKGADFSQSVLVEAGEDSTYGQSVTALSMPLVENVSIKLSYTLKHNSVVPAGTKHTDSYTAINVGYSF